MEEESIQTNPLANIEQPKNEPITSELTSINKAMVGNMYSDIKAKADQGLQYTQNYRNTIAQQNIANPLDAFKNDKIKLQDYSIDTRDVYTELNSGDLVARYENFLPGVDNNERLAQQQTASSKWANGTGKFFTKTGTAIVGGTAGVVYGVFDAIKEGSFTNVYDNNFTNWLDDLDTRMDNKLPNYYTKQEQEHNFFQGLGDANFWANDVLGAASFTVGAIVSEGIWAAATGGTSLTTIATRRATQVANKLKWGKVALGTEKVAAGIAKNKNIVKTPLKAAYSTEKLATQGAINVAKATQFANTTRFLLTSSGYEAGVEARHFKKEAEENFYRNFQEQYGRNPTGAEIADFEEGMNNSANALFAGNMAVLSVSNAVMFGSLFNIQSPFKGATKNINKTLFGIGVEKTTTDTGKTLYKALAPTKRQKIFSGAYSITKPLFTEGIWEEGGQGVMSKTAGHWLESTYSPKYNNQTLTLMDAMYQSMGEQFSTKEGWKEMGIGFIIGGGASVIQGKGKMQELRQIQEARKFQEEKVATGYNTFSEDAIAKRIIMNSKVQNALEREKQADSKGDYVKSTLANDDVLIAEIEFRHSIGEDVSELVETYKIALDNVSAEEWVDQGIENVEEYKEAVISAYSDLTKRYKKNVQYAQAVFGVGELVGNLGQKEQYAQALAYTLTVGENASKAMETTLDEIGKSIGEESKKSIQLQTELNRTSSETRAQIENQNKQIVSLQEQQKKLVAQLTKLQNAPKETEGDRQGGQQLAEVQTRLLEVEEQTRGLIEQREQIARDISREIELREGLDQEIKLDVNTTFISGQDLADLGAKLEKLDNSIEGYKDTNPQMYQRLKNLGNSYKSAEESFFNYNKASVALASGNVRIKSSRVGGLIGKVFNPKGDVSDFTKEFLEDISTNYGTRKLEEGVNAENQKSAAEITPESVVDKIRKGETLTKEEQEFYNTNKESIDNQVKDVNKSEGDHPGQKETVVTEGQTEEENLVSLKQRVQDVLNSPRFPINYEGQEVEEMTKQKPSKEDIEEYRELLRNAPRTEEQDARFEELRAKLGNWRLYDSITDGELSLAEILSLIQQLETQLEQEQVKDEVTEEDTVEMFNDTISKTSDATTVYELTQNTAGNATVRKEKDSKTKETVFSFHHIKIETILERLGGTFEVLNEKQKPQKVKNLEGATKYGNIFRITPEGSEGSVDFVIGRGGSIRVKETDFINLQQALNLYIVDTGNINWSYKDVYEFNGQEFVEKESDFLGDKLNGDTYELEAGEDVELYYDALDEWNVEQAKLYEKGKITKEEYINSIKVYIRKGNKNYQTLKSLREDSADEKMMAIRQKAFDQSINGTSAVIGGVTTSQVVLGSPKLSLDENQKPEEIEFTDRALGEVVATGYILDNEFTLSDKSLEDKTDQSFVGKTSKRNIGKKIPVVVFKKGAHTVAYAVTLKKNASPRTQELSNILNNADLTEADKVSEINSLLISQGIAPSKYNLTSLKQEQKLEEIAKELEENTVFRSPEEMASPEYRKEDLKNDATIQIDLEDLGRSISSPKLRIDLDSATLLEQRDVKYASMIELETGLNTLAQELQSFVLRPGVYVDAKGEAVENNFTEVFSEREVIKNPSNNLEILSNINILAEAYKAMPAKAKEMFGKDKAQEIENLLKQYNTIKRRLKPIKNSETAATEENLKC